MCFWFFFYFEFVSFFKNLDFGNNTNSDPLGQRCFEPPLEVPLKFLV